MTTSHAYSSEILEREWGKDECGRGRRGEEMSQVKLNCSCMLQK